jgi:hypothetical protein
LTVATIFICDLLPGSAVLLGAAALLGSGLGRAARVAVRARVPVAARAEVPVAVRAAVDRTNGILGVPALADSPNM